MKIVKVSGDQALQELERYRSESSRTKLYPFLIGSDEEVEQLKDSLEPPKDGGESILRQALEFDIVSWLSEKQPKKKAAWPKKPLSPSTGIASLYDILTGQPKPEINIGLVEVNNNDWEVFARIGYGGWNDCPPAHIHVALQKYWDEKYKTSLLCLSGAVMEHLVLGPPQDKEEAITLAHEQNAYCYDIVEQGVGSVGKLASSLLNSKYWYFWWD